MTLMEHLLGIAGMLFFFGGLLAAAVGYACTSVAGRADDRDAELRL